MPAITTTDGVEIFYKDWGKGPPIVFSHGYTEIIGLHGLTEFGEREFFNRPAHVNPGIVHQDIDLPAVRKDSRNRFGN